MYSPLTVATEGGGVAVGGTGVDVGNAGVGVFGGAKSEVQALNPNIKIRNNDRLLKSFLLPSDRRVSQETSEVLLKEHGLVNIGGIIR
jgi:hypothetical protein